MFLEILSWVMSGIALIGTLLNAERNKWGFVFWLVSNFYLTLKFWYIAEYAQSILFAIYTLLAIRGIYKWTEEEFKAKGIKQIKNANNTDI